jgi:hypothetical protein
MQQAGLLAWHILKSLPVIKTVAKNLRIKLCFYSYGDSAGITPASLLIPYRKLSGSGTNYVGKCSSNIFRIQKQI